MFGTVDEVLGWDGWQPYDPKTPVELGKPL